MSMGSAYAQEAEEAVAEASEIVETAQAVEEQVTETQVAAVQEVAPVDEMRTTTLPAGTMVKFRMNQALATDKREKVDGKKLPKGQRRITNEGDTFTMTVVNDVMSDDVMVIPAGSIAHGEVTVVKGRGGFGKSGKIEITMKYVEVGDKQYAIEGTHYQKGKSRGAAAVAGTIIAGALAGAFIKGAEADIPLATEFDFITAEDIVATGKVVEPVEVAVSEVSTEPAADAPASDEVATEE